MYKRQNLYRSWGADVIGMTNMPEAKLAREAEIRYASVSMVTDYDCWHPDHENVDVQQVIKVLLDNAAKAKNMIKNLIENFENHIDPNDPTNSVKRKVYGLQRVYEPGDNTLDKYLRDSVIVTVNTRNIGQAFQ